MRIRKLALASVLAAAAAVGGTTPAHAAQTGGECNGIVDASCSYCSYGGGNSGYDPYWCPGGGGYYNGSSYRWETCAVWVSGVCEVG